MECLWRQRLFFFFFFPHFKEVRKIFVLIPKALFYCLAVP